MSVSVSVLLGLDLAGTFAFALNGALTAVRNAKVDLVGVVTLGLVTAVGGGFLRDLLLGALPPATFGDWRYLVVAIGGSLLAFLFSRTLDRLALPIVVLDAAGLSLFAVSGTGKAIAFGVGPVQAIILGTVTAVGGGTIRDVLIRQLPGVLSSGLYAVPALMGASVVAVLHVVGVNLIIGVPVTLFAAVLVFVIRMVGLRFGLEAPKPPGMSSDS